MSQPPNSDPMEELAHQCLDDLEDIDLSSVDADNLRAELQNLYDMIGGQAMDPNIEWDAFTELLRGVICQSYRLKRVREVQDKTEPVHAEA